MKDAQYRFITGEREVPDENGTCPRTSKKCKRAYMAGGCHAGTCLIWWDAERQKQIDYQARTGKPWNMYRASTATRIK